MNTVLPSLDDLPEWVSDELVEHAELAFNGGRFVTNSHVMLAVSGPSWSFASTTSDIMKRKDVIAPAAELRPGMVEFDSQCGLNDLIAYSVPLGPVSIALRYYALVRVLYGDVQWFGTGELDPVVAKRAGQIVAIVMPVRSAPRPVDSP